MKYKITKEFQDQRLDKFLTEKIKDKTRSQLQNIIKAGAVKVNQKIRSVHYFLQTGDIVEVGQAEPIKKTVVVKNDKTNKLFSSIKIISETKDYLVINKPAGLLAQNTEAIGELALTDWLVEKYPSIRKIGEDPARPGIVHRLDRDVSGLMVIAKTQDSFDSLKKQFQKRTIAKNYVALVYGEIKKDHGQIDFPIERSTRGYKMAAKPTSQGGRRAITEFAVVKRLINYTLLKLKIITGRTHQIRVHLSAYGFPLVGDDLYSTKTTREKNKKLGLPRIFLIATNLAFIDLAGEKQEFEIKLPEELEKVLGKVK